MVTSIDMYINWQQLLLVTYKRNSLNTDVKFYILYLLESSLAVSGMDFSRTPSNIDLSVS